jgi:hypothetical protein
MTPRDLIVFVAGLLNGTTLGILTALALTWWCR